MEHADRSWVRDYVDQSADAMAALPADAAVHVLAAMATKTIPADRAGGQLLFAGTAQHSAIEFTGRLVYDADPLPVTTRTTCSPVLTATGNDYGLDDSSERQLRGPGPSRDVFLEVSTSGNAPNVMRASQAARAMSVPSFGVTGLGGGPLAALCAALCCSPGNLTPYIQMVQITAGRIYRGLIERIMCPVPEIAVA